MNGRGRAPGRHTAAGLALLLLAALLAALVAGCGGRPAADGTRTAVQDVLDRRAAALLDRDAAAWAATGDPAGYDRLRAVPLAAWSYRVTAVHDDGPGSGGDALRADAELRYRIAGYDRAPVTTDRVLRLVRDPAGRWRVTGERPAPKTGEQLWDRGTVTAVRGTHSLVLGVGGSAERLRTQKAVAGLADRAVPAVTDAWGPRWPRRVLVLVPDTLDGMAALLGAPASDYRGIAAVTTGETGGGPGAPADRIIVNPEAYGLLGASGRQVVLTHETTHVATRTATNAATPLWLSEGYADWVGYRGTGRTPRDAAPELEKALRDGQEPAALPPDDDFGFTGDAGRLARAYEGGWLACRMIAERWGEGRLDAFYRAVGERGKRAGAVEGALREVLGVDLADFTARWRTYVREELG
ncbi:hypothetical protein ACFWNK_25995 [Streptomyces sp. NPDC058417]|uniref:hypothetical protein n=1 Tax=unclassified Streptomyces TaxID=2593676 RepID=UPI003657751F